MTDKTPSSHEEKEGNTHIPGSHGHKEKKSFIDRCVGNPGFPWMVIAILFTLLIIMFYREHFSLYQNSGYRGNVYYMRNSMMGPGMSHMRDGGMRFRSYDIENEIKNFQSERDEIFAHMDRMRDSMMNPPASIGKYSGTRIINDKTIEYFLDIGEKSISGTLSGTDTEMIEGFIHSLKNLGYSVENNSLGGYTFTGEANKSPLVIQLFQ